MVVNSTAGCATLASNITMAIFFTILISIELGLETLGRLLSTNIFYKYDAIKHCEGQFAGGLADAEV
ncbi:hypothetical protein RIF29_29021 [Crotalaria pallida]|uniref:Uncharacterized protein n=1 Tax=Crotalaria pallida TaxID=3830 RepID=A0AAN9HTI1_CROPI